MKVIMKLEWKDTSIPYTSRAELFVNDISLGSVWKAGSLESYGGCSSLPGTPNTDYFPTSELAIKHVEQIVLDWFSRINEIR